MHTSVGHLPGGGVLFSHKEFSSFKPRPKGAALFPVHKGPVAGSSSPGLDLGDISVQRKEKGNVHMEDS